MSVCPYTWFRDLLALGKISSGRAQNLRVIVMRSGINVVDVALPSRSARWLIELIPDDVLVKIRAEGVPIDSIQKDLATIDVLTPRRIFELDEPNRQVYVWLE